MTSHQPLVIYGEFTVLRVDSGENLIVIPIIYHPKRNNNRK